MWGIGLMAAAIVCALAIHLSLAGPLGDAVDRIASFTFGVGGVALPAALATLGVALVRGEPAASGRTVVGFGGLAISGTGLLHLARGGPGIGGDLDAVREAGGVSGAVVGGTLRALLAPTGASVVLVAVAVVALLVLARTSARDVAVGVAATSRPPLRRVWDWLGSLTRLDADTEKPAPTDQTDNASGRPVIEANGVRLYDQDRDGTDPTAEPRPDGTHPVAASPGAAGATVPDADRPPADLDEDGRPPFDVPPADAQPALDLGPAATKTIWKLPKTSLLSSAGEQEVDQHAVEEGGRTLEHALAQHGVETRLVGMTVGPTVTRYELELGSGVKVAKVTSLHRDIAYAMASPDVRIIAPIPGRSAIGVEVPNQKRHQVALGDILDSAEARRAKHPLEVGLGRDIAGRPVLLNLAQTPHLLIAGATGAGKSSCINSVITSLMLRSTPDEVRLILVDPKRVELGQYNGLPHLITQVVVDPKKAANALQWAVKEMERRYDLLAEVGVRDISGYNSAYDRGDLRDDPTTGATYERLPFIVVVVDELSDLMMVAARDVEASICRIAQMARAVGIHLVIATQRPSVNVITGVIKANVPARLAFAVSSGTDSKVILDTHGAERLIGKGDMLFLGPSSSTPRRIQGSWVEEDEVRKIVTHWKRQAPELSYVEGVVGEGGGSQSDFFADTESGDDDEDKLWDAMELIVRSGLGSTSMLQRKLGVGFARAGRLMDLLEQKGVVGPSVGPKAREVLMTIEELEALTTSV